VLGNGDFYVIVAEQVSTDETTYAGHIGDCETLLKVRSAKLQVCEDIGVADRAANPDQLAYGQFAASQQKGSYSARCQRRTLRPSVENELSGDTVYARGHFKTILRQCNR
jgi:hypothetical protein